MLVTNKKDTPLDEYLYFIKICARSGVTAVQLREKNVSFSSLMTFGNKLKKILSPFNIPLIINDDINLAIELDAHGVHLGQSDGDILAARTLLGPDKIIGISADSVETLSITNSLEINYVGVGAIFSTAHKKDVRKIIGLEELTKLSIISKHPMIAIGGIDVSNAASVLKAGAHGIAAIGAFHTHHYRATIQHLRSLIDKR
jgi:thiamine-phosphate pyrophosphorylase